MQSRNLILLLTLCLLFLPLSTAYLGTFPQNSCVNIKVLSNCSSVTLSQVETKTSEYVINSAMQNLAGQTYNYSFCNTTEIGQYKYSWDESCADCSGGLCGNDFGITPDGDELGASYTATNIFLILFVIGLGLLFFFTTRKVDYEKWNNKVIGRYENKNYVKLVLTSIAVNIMRNSYIVYYILGLPIIVLVTAMANAYSLTSAVEILRVVTIIYFVGVVIVGIYFLGKVQEWFMELLNKISDMNWGIER